MTAAWTIARLVTTVASLTLISSCATSGHIAGPAARATGAAPTASPNGSTPTPLDGCFTRARGQVETIRDTGGGTLMLGIVGTGPRVVVLSNESDEDLCSWLPLSARLTATGYRVVLWDYGGNPAAAELATVVKTMRSQGANRVVLMGASEGAKASLIAGAQIRPAVQGVVSLSAESILNPAIEVVDFVRHLRCPVLFLTAKQDPYGSAPAGRQFLAAAPTEAKALLTVHGADHGTALLAGRSAAKTLPAILAFMRRELR